MIENVVWGGGLHAQWSPGAEFESHYLSGYLTFKFLVVSGWYLLALLTPHPKPSFVSGLRPLKWQNDPLPLLHVIVSSCDFCPKVEQAHLAKPIFKEAFLFQNNNNNSRTALLYQCLVSDRPPCGTPGGRASLFGLKIKWFLFVVRRWPRERRWVKASLRRGRRSASRVCVITGRAGD